MKVTRIATSKNPNAGKYAALEEQARHLGTIRSEVWQRYGSIGGLNRGDRSIRDEWLARGRTFAVSANAWKETLRDAKADIAMTVEAAKVKVRSGVRRRTGDETERKRLYTLLKNNRFTEDSWLRRKMRRHWKHGRNHTHNQIVVRSDNDTTFQLGGRAWVKIPGLERGKRIAIPLNTTVEPAGTLRVILRDARVEVHYAVEVKETVDCGDRTLGVDKGYTEVLVDSHGDHHGEGLGEALKNESDARKFEEPTPRQAARHCPEHRERTQAPKHHRAQPRSQESEFTRPQSASEHPRDRLQGGTPSGGQSRRHRRRGLDRPDGRQEILKEHQPATGRLDQGRHRRSIGNGISASRFDARPRQSRLYLANGSSQRLPARQAFRRFVSLFRRGGIAGGRERRAQRVGKTVRSRDGSLDAVPEGRVHLAGTDRAPTVGTAQPGLQLRIS